MISKNSQSPSISAALSSALASSSSSSPTSPTSSTGVSPAGSSVSSSAPTQRPAQDKTRKEFESQVADDGTTEASGSGSAVEAKDSKDSKEAKDSREPKEAKETKVSKEPKAEREARGKGQASMANQILRQLVKQNPDAKPAALQFLEGTQSPGAIEELPQLMASSRFIMDALIEEDLGGYMNEDVKPSNVMRELGFGPELITQALALGVDSSGPLQRGQVLGALGADPKRVESDLNRLKGAIALEGVAGYMQQSLAMAKSSGKQTGIMDKMTGPEVEETGADLLAFKSTNSLETQAIMAQALVSASSWGPHNMGKSIDVNFQSIGLNSLDAGSSAGGVLDMLTGMSGGDQAMLGVMTESQTPVVNSGQQEQAVISSSTDLAEFKASLQAEFGDSVKVIGTGRAAWEEFGASAAFDNDVAAGFGDAVTFESMRAPDLMDREGLMDRKNSQGENQPSGQEFKNESGDVARSADETEKALPESNLLSNIERGIAQDGIKAADTADAPAQEKAERSEIKARHASDAFRKIQDAIRHTSVSNIGAMRLDLSSPEAGNLEVAVRIDKDGQVDVRVMAGSGELRELVARELTQLKSALSEQNLNLREFTTRAWTGAEGNLANQGRSQGFENDRHQDSSLAGATSSGRSPGQSIAALNEQMGRQALRSFRIVDLSDRSLGGDGRIKVLA
jgi:hypothetical protein